MIPLILAAVISCVTPQGAKLTLAREVAPDHAHALGLSSDHWLWLGLDADPIRWPSGQSIEVKLHSGRVVRARTLLLLTPDEEGEPQPISRGVAFLGRVSVVLDANDYAGKRSRSTGKWNTVVFAGFAEPVPMDSIAGVQTGGSP